MGYRLVLYENHVNKDTFEVKWIKRMELVPDSFDITNNTLFLGEARYTVKMQYDEWRDLKSYVWIAALFDDEWNLYHMGPVTGFRGRIMDDGWKIELYAKELLALWECVYSFNPILGASDSTLKTFYYEIFLQKNAHFERWWDRGVKEIEIHNENQEIPLQSHFADPSAVPTTETKSVTEWILNIARVEPQHVFKFIPILKKSILDGFVFRTAYTFERLYPMITVEFDRVGHSLVASNSNFEGFEVVAAQNYWNSVLVESGVEGTTNTYGEYFLNIPSTPHFELMNIETSGSVERSTVVLHGDAPQMRVTKRTDLKQSRDEVGDWESYASGLLQYGLKGLANLRARYIGHWNDIHLHQKVVLKYKDKQDVYFVGEKRLSSNGVTSVGFVKDLKDLNITLI